MAALLLARVKPEARSLLTELVRAHTGRTPDVTNWKAEPELD